MVGFAADIYGADKQTVSNMTERGELATYYRDNPAIFAEQIQAAVEVLKAHEKVDNTKIGLFGYCFGGSGVLMYGMEGFGAEDVQAVVSFHGGLSQLQETNNTFAPQVLVLSGGDDDMSSEIMGLEMMLDTAQAPWEITRYSGIEHAFTKWDDERYNEWADMRSWESAGHFILEAFGITEFASNEPSAENTTAVDYVSSVDGTPLRGHLAMPSGEWQRPLPAVVVL
jgi:dienelactone hydrolase